MMTIILDENRQMVLLVLNWSSGLQWKDSLLDSLQLPKALHKPQYPLNTKKHRSIKKPTSLSRYSNFMFYSSYPFHVYWIFALLENKVKTLLLMLLMLVVKP